MPTTRSPAEILERIQFTEARDVFGVLRGHLVFALPYQLAQTFFTEPLTEAQFIEARGVQQEPLVALRDYLPFAWEKANDCKGLSAIRSHDHLTAFLWLAGFDIHWPSYSHYGKKQLVIASVLADFDWRKVDNGHWVNSETEPQISEAERDVEAEQGERIAMQAMAAQAA